MLLFITKQIINYTHFTMKGKLNGLMLKVLALTEEGNDVFVHYTGIVEKVLSVSMNVEFEITQGKRGLRQSMLLL